MNVDFTTTHIEPTQEELERKIVHHAIQYSYKKWYEDKSYHLSKIKYYSQELSKRFFCIKR